MSRRQRNSRPSAKHLPLQHERNDEIFQGKASSPSLKRPQGNNPDEWKAYWPAQGQDWRIEPEISPKRQAELKKYRNTPADEVNGIYPFKDVKLERADIEWLLATHENGRGPVLWGDVQQRTRKRLDLRGADLINAQLEGADLSGAWLEGADLSGAWLEGADLSGARLQRARLGCAGLQRAKLRYAELQEANLFMAELQGADLSAAQLQGANLFRAELQGADLSAAQLESTTLEGITLSGKDKIGPCFADIQWGNTNLAVVDWTQATRLGDEYFAPECFLGQLWGYLEATRANRQLAVALQGQGLNEDAMRFAYRANVCQRKVLWYQIFVKLAGEELEKKKWYKLVGNWLSLLGQRVRRFGSFCFSLFLDVLAGYGYKPERTVGWYLLIVFGFALSYAVFGHLPFWPDALVYSLTSFHGRGFLPGLNGQTSPLHHPLVVMAAFEAVAGLLVEISFIATFTQRYFGK